MLNKISNEPLPSTHRALSQRLNNVITTSRVATHTGNYLNILGEKSVFDYTGNQMTGENKRI